MPDARTVSRSATSRESTATAGPRVLYLQYSNPGVYPPVVHGARLLADSGCDVLLLGTTSTDAALTVDAHPRVQTRLLPAPSGGWRLKLHYARFTLWALAWALRWRPSWLYVSDPIACPAADAVQRVTGVAAIYHEHDSPDEDDGGQSRSAFMRVALRARRRMAASAAACVLPNEERVRTFTRTTGRTDALCVWNCPLTGEATSGRERGGSAMRVVYHGSVVPARLPLTVVDALADLPSDVTLTVVGYETIGHHGYLDALTARARERGVADRLTIARAVPRSELMRQITRFDVGLALLPLSTTDLNERTMIGASNKPFDYMAGGLALLVADRPEWRDAYVVPGYGLACDPASVSSIVHALGWLRGHASERHAMGERGRAQITSSWNYEATFAPVRRLIHARQA